MALPLTFDVLVLVFEHLATNKRLLYQVLCLNKEVHSVVFPQLYRNAQFFDLLKFLKFSQAINVHPKSPGNLVQELYIVALLQLSTLEDIRRNEINEALTRMPNLRDLSLYGPDIANLLTAPVIPFRLNSLSVSPPITAPIWTFIKSHKSINELNLSYNFGDRCFDPSNFSSLELLPNLSSLSCCPKLFTALAPNRPISSAVIRSCAEHSLNLIEMIHLITAMNASSGSLKTLYIDGFSSDTNGWEFVRCLGTMRPCSTLTELTFKDSIMVRLFLQGCAAFVNLRFIGLCDESVPGYGVLQLAPAVVPRIPFSEALGSAGGH